MSVSIVTQTGVRADRSEAFARWQGETSTIIASFPGFIEQRLLPPKPPLQIDWVILQRFQTLEDAQRWLTSPERAKRLEGIADMVVGRDDVHIVREDAEAARASPVSAVISQRVKRGKEAEFLAWEHKIAAAQSKAPGLQGYRFEPPVPDVQEDFVAILRFDSEANLNAWLESPVRRKLLEEASPLLEEFHARMARTGFEQWFRDTPGASSTMAVWKMNMLVLLLLYPIVFLFGVFVHTPIFMNMLNMPFAIALFLGNIVSVTMTGYLVPLVAGYFGWWLQPTGKVALTNVLGAVIIGGLYAACMLAFWKLF